MPNAPNKAGIAPGNSEEVEEVQQALLGLMRQLATAVAQRIREKSVLAEAALEGSGRQRKRNIGPQ